MPFNGTRISSAAATSGAACAQDKHQNSLVPAQLIGTNLSRRPLTSHVVLSAAI